MAKYKLASLDQWARKSKKRMDVVVKQATNDMLVNIDTGPSITRSGNRKKGTIPVDLGTLAASLQSTLYGSTSFTNVGEASYILAVASIKAGDVARFTWGGDIAPYARAVHYGANGVQGTFWVDVAVGKWPGYVAGAVAKAKARVA